MKLKLHVIPNSSQNQICGWHGDALKIKITAPPVDGKANKEIVRFLASCFNVSNKDVTILHGDTGKTKLVEIKIDLITGEQVLKSYLNQQWIKIYSLKK